MASLVNASIIVEDASRVVEDRYSRIKSQSVDMLILEHCDNVYIAPCTFGWADVGSWKNLYDLHQKDSEKNVTNSEKSLFYESRNNLVYTSSDKVVVLQDLDGYVVVENENILMVCRKDDPALIRKIMNDAKLKFGDDIK